MAPPPRTKSNRDAHIVDTPQPNASVVRESRTCSLTIVMALFTALLVLAVAAITFAITYTTSLDALQSVGKSYAISLVTTASVRVTDIFEAPASQVRAFGTQFKRFGSRLPSEDPTIYGFMNSTSSGFLSLTLSLPGVYDSLGLAFDDGSITAVSNLGNGAVGYYSLNNALISNQTAKCCAPFLAVAYQASTMKEMPYVLRGESSPGLAPNALTPGYLGVRGLFSTYVNSGLWLNALFSDYELPGTFALPAMFPVRNQTHFIGIITGMVKVTKMIEFIKTITLTPNSYIFITDETRSITGTTYPAPYTTLTPSNDPSPQLLPSNCATTAAFYTNPTFNNFTIACRTLAQDYPYEPLRQVVSRDDIMTPSVPLAFNKITVGSEEYYVASASFTNSLPPASIGFKLYTQLFLPESDVIGDVVAARNTVIGIIAGVFVLASVLAAGVIHLFLRPLKTVASKMHSTARLHEVVDRDSEFSQLKEVYDLQLAFHRMNNAIGSFTRYVPRDVVKDLMKTGQLCQIQMTEKICSMLFVDIAHFTTMCERVPAEELSRLVQLYFEQMSNLVTTHDGLIDKYIGDCIMAVWGAPFACDHQEIKSALCGMLMNRETQVDPLYTGFDSAGEHLSVRVGVASGHVLAGNMGSTERMSYTVIGDPVNIAARLESLNKQFGTRVMIDEQTAKQCEQIFCLRKLLKIAVVGKDTGVTVYEVLGLHNDVHTEAMVRLRDHRRRSNTSFSDSASNASSRHSGVTAEHRTAAALLDAARSLTTAHPVVSDATLKHAEAFTQAVDFYISAKFHDCLRVLAALPTEKSDVAHTRLCELAEQGTRMDPQALALFDGVWRSDEK